ncbi:flagellar type III secretion system pore protein FliP [bacterium]|nr:flagellar type III secretion system pore protein FliP [bacterium]
MCLIGGAWAADIPIPKVDLQITQAKNAKDVALTIQLLVIFTILSLAPSLVMLMTAYLRVFIVLSFVERALGLQQMPPRQILAGMAMFLTFYIMAPTFTKIYHGAAEPFYNQDIPAKQAYGTTMHELRKFMFSQTHEKDIGLFFRLSSTPSPSNRGGVPTHILVPAFVLSELKTAFTMGILIYVPFIVIDMVVASILMSMGMIMVPPVMISLPIKVLIFVLVNGWDLLMYSIVKSYHLT